MAPGRKRKLFYWLIIPLLLLGLIAVPFIRSPINAFRKTIKMALRLWGIQEKSVNFGNLTVRYFEGGEENSNTVILLHGFGGNALFTWMTLLPSLQKKNHVIAPDLLASNFVRLNPQTYSVEQEEILVLKLMEELKITKADFVGLSVGGWVSLLLALEYPEKVGKLILVESAGIRTEIPEIARLTLDDREKARHFLELLFYHQPPIPGFVLDQMVKSSKAIKKKYTEVFAGFLRNSEKFLVDERLADIHQPTLIIHGRQDRVMPLEVGERLHRGIVGSKMLVLEESGHAPVWDSPFQLRRAILDFLAEPLPVSPVNTPNPVTP